MNLVSEHFYSKIIKENKLAIKINRKLDSNKITSLAEMREYSKNQKIEKATKSNL